MLLEFLDLHAGAVKKSDFAVHSVAQPLGHRGRKPIQAALSDLENLVQVPATLAWEYRVVVPCGQVLGGYRRAAGGGICEPQGGRGLPGFVRRRVGFGGGGKATGLI